MRWPSRMYDLRKAFLAEPADSLSTTLASTVYQLIVKVRFFTRLREITGKSEEPVELCSGSTVRRALEALSAKHGREFDEYVLTDEPGGFQLQFLVNGRSVAQMQGLETELRDGDTLAIVPPVGGGQISSTPKAREHVPHGTPCFDIQGRVEGSDGDR